MQKDYENNRRVDISFVFYAHDAHDAQAMIYEVVAPSVNTKKELTIDISEFKAKACFRDKNKHKKEIYVVDVGQVIDKGDSKQIFTKPSFNYKIYSDLSLFNAFPIQFGPFQLDLINFICMLILVGITVMKENYGFG